MDFAQGMKAAGAIGGGVLAGMQGRQQQQPMRARYGQVASRVPGNGVNSPGGPIGPVAGSFGSGPVAPQVGANPDEDQNTDMSYGLPPGGGGESGDSGDSGYALGGVVTRPTRAILGEAGPEAVVPLRPGMGGGNGARMRPSAIPSMGRSKLKMPALPLGRRSSVGV